MQFNWDNLSQNSIPQLKAEAEALSIFIPPRSKKSEIIRILEQEKPRLLSPPQTPIMTVSSRYEKENLPEIKVDLHQEALDSMRRNPMPSTPTSFLAKVVVETNSPRPRNQLLSPVLGSPSVIPLYSPRRKEISKKIDLPEFSSSSSSAAMSAHSSRDVSPNDAAYYSTPVITKERSVTPIHSPKINTYYSQYRVSTYTSVINVILIISTLILFVLSIGDQFYNSQKTDIFILTLMKKDTIVTYFTVSLVLLIIVRLLRRYEIKAKSKNLANAVRSLRELSTAKASFNADNTIIEAAKKHLNSAK